MSWIKRSVTGLLFLVTILILSACGWFGDDPDTEVLRVVNFRVEDQAFYDWMIDQFTAENPHVRIEYDAVDTANYPQLLGARIASGDLDVFFGEPHNVFDGSRSGSMLPLNDLDILDQIIEEYLSTGRLHDFSTDQTNQLIVPLNTTGMVVFYNQDLFAEHQLDVPQDWSEFVALLDALDSIANVDAPIIYGGREQWPANMILNAVEAQIVRVAQPDFYQMLRRWDEEPSARFNNDEWVETFTKTNTIFQYVQRNATGLSYAAAPSLFVTGNPQNNRLYPLMIDGSWSAAQILAAGPDFEVGTFILPSNDEAENNRYLPFKPGAGLSVFNRSENIELAKEFVTFHYRQDVYEKYLEMTLFGSVMTDISQTHPLTVGVFESGYTPLMIAENSIVPGMPWDTNEGLTNMLLGLLTPLEFANAINNSIATQRTVWLQNIDLVNEKPE